MHSEHATVAIFTDQYEQYQKLLIESIAVEVNKRGYGMLCVTGRERGYGTHTTDSRDAESNLEDDPDFSLDNEIYGLLKKQNIKGLISISGTIGHNSHVRKFTAFMQEFQIPQVSLGMAIPGITSVLIDVSTGMKALMEHLTQDTNAKNFAFLRGFADDPFSLKRETVFRDVLQRTGYEINEDLIITGNYDRFDAYQAVTTLLQEHEGEVDAIVAANDLMALSAARAATALGVQIPWDLIVTGYDDTNHATLNSPALTTVRQPVTEIANACTDLLLEQIGGWSERESEGTSSTVTRVVGTELVIRGSSRNQILIQNDDSHDSRQKLLERIDTSMRGLESPDNVDLQTIIESLWKTLMYKGDHLAQTLGPDVVKTIDIKHQHWWNNLCYQIESASQHLLANSPNERSDLARIMASLVPIKERTWALTMEREFETQRFQNARTNMLNKMSSCSTLPDILATLDDWLKFVKPRRCYLVSFATPSATPDKRACLIYSSYDGVMQDLPREWFDSQDLLPPSLTDELNNGLLLLNPVFTGDTHFGYMLFDPTGLETVDITAVTLCIGNAMRNRHMLLKLEQQTEDLRQANADLVQLASFDALTGLPNRFQFHQKLVEKFRIATARNTDLGVLFIDLDGFKTINDTLGHQAGDKLLTIIANRIKQTVEQTAGNNGFVARLGGDEFTVILDSRVNDDSIEALTRKVLVELCKPCKILDQHVSVSASIGYSVLTSDIHSAETMLNQADSAMYHAKARGKNCVLKFSHATDAADQERVRLDIDLRKALADKDLVMHFQPRIDLATNKICSAEALMRWICETDEGPKVVASPNQFIPVAEESGFITELDKFALEQCCQQIFNWQSQGISLPLSVNLSINRLQQKDFVSEVLDTIAQHSINPSMLEFEITEGAAMSDVESNIAKMRTLREAGVKLSIDDFGTGYSSLQYLKQLPVDNLKIDRSFILEISASARDDVSDAAIIRSIVALGKSMKMRLIAEGVETEHQHQFVKELGCDEVQGFYFHKPMSAASITGLMSNTTNANRAA